MSGVTNSMMNQVTNLKKNASQIPRYKLNYNLGLQYHSSRLKKGGSGPYNLGLNRKLWTCEGPGAR